MQIDSCEDWQLQDILQSGSYEQSFTFAQLL